MTDTTAAKWNFTDDEARRNTIIEEAEINRNAAVEVAEAANPGWPWIAFWIGLFAYFIATLFVRS